MPPPLLLLQEINLTFGVTPLLAGAALAVAAGDRICLVGRNGSGKSILLRIAAGLVQPDAGERFAQPGTTIQYLSQEPALAGFTTTLAYVEAGFDAAAAAGHHRALYLLKELGLSGAEDPASLADARATPAPPPPLLRPRPADAQSGAAGRTARAAPQGAGVPRGDRNSPARRGAGGFVGPARCGDGRHLQGIWRPHGRAKFFAAGHARRPARHRGPERCRQDHVAQFADRRARSRCGRDQARHQSGAGHALLKIEPPGRSI